MHELIGTWYLGLQRDPAYCTLVARGLDTHGVGNPISRSSGYAFAPLEAAEEAIGLEFQQPEACLFSSGYLASTALSRVLGEIAAERGMSMALEASSHPGIASRLNVGDEGVDDQAMHRALRERGPDGGWICVCDSVNSLYGFPSAGLWNSAVLRNAKLCAIDVSHTAFLWRHEDWLSAAGLLPNQAVLFGSLNKAAAFPAGFVTGPADIIARLRQGPEYRASSPPACGLAEAFVAARALRQEKLQHLNRLMEIAQPLRWKDIDFALPAYRLDPGSDIYHAFLREGYKLSFFSYPLGASHASLRAMFNAGLTEGVVQAFIALCRRWEMVAAVEAPAVAWHLADPIKKGESP